MNYIDTANYEPENTDDPKWRRSMKSAAEKKDSLHILTTAGSGITLKIPGKEPDSRF